MTSTEPEVRHEYLSTACWHAKFDGNPDLCRSCRNDCKWCSTPCDHECHQTEGTQPATGSRVDEARDIARRLLAALNTTGEGLIRADHPLYRQIQSDPALFWLRGEEQPPGQWTPKETDPS